MKKITVYQTLKDKDYWLVEDHGPYKCRWENTWLGDGYYFWEEFIEIAHWWGENHRKGSYIICRAECSFDDRCLDLVGSMRDIRLFRDSLKEFITQELVNESTTVSRIISYMRDVVGNFKYEAIRVYGINSISPNIDTSKEYSERLAFEVDKPQYLDVLPAVQICLYENVSLDLTNYKIVHPEHYCEDYVF